MREWIVITLLGCLGGLIVTPFPKGTDVPFDPLFSAVLASNKWAILIAHTLLNILAGGIASFILWAGYTSNVDLQSTRIAGGEMAAALTVGLGGVGIVRNLIAKAQASTTWAATAKESADTAEILQKKLDKAHESADNNSTEESHKQDG